MPPNVASFISVPQAKSGRGELISTVMVLLANLFHTSNNASWDKMKNRLLNLELKAVFRGRTAWGISVS